MHDAKKRMGLAFLSLLGAFRVGRWLSRRCVLVLTYHRILPDEYQNKGRRPANSLFRWEFEKQVVYLVRHYHVVSGEEVRAFLAGEEKPPPHSVLITFDDGYKNNYTEALPILQRHNASAIFFITSDFVGKPDARLWFDRLTTILSNVPLDDVVECLKHQGATSNAQSETQLRQWFKRLSPARRDRMIAELEQIIGQGETIRADTTVMAPMSWEQVRELVACGMTIGSHTVNHQILSSLSSEEVRNELVESRQRLEQEIGRPCWCFGYPNGEAADFRPADKAAVQAAGYACAFTQTPGFVNFHSDRYALPRTPIPDTGDMRVFLSRLTGVHGALQILRYR